MDTVYSSQILALQSEIDSVEGEANEARRGALKDPTMLTKLAAIDNQAANLRTELSQLKKLEKQEVEKAKAEKAKAKDDAELARYEEKDKKEEELVFLNSEREVSQTQNRVSQNVANVVAAEVEDPYAKKEEDKPAITATTSTNTGT